MELTDKVVKEKHLTTIMVTHNLRYAVEYGDRLLMMHQGHAIIDKAGEEKNRSRLSTSWISSMKSALNAATEFRILFIHGIHLLCYTVI